MTAPDVTSLEEAFVQAICAEPGEDTHRLAYADWLEERGDPAALARAEFIRTQIELARLPKNDRRARDLRRREKQLWRENRSAWLEAVPGGLRSRYLTFQRGFLETIRLSAADLLLHGDDLFRRHPLQRVWLDRAVTAEEASALAARPFLARLTGLTVGQKVTFYGPFARIFGTLADAEAQRALLGSPHLSGLKELSLAASGLGSGGAAVLAACPLLGRLTALDLSYCLLRDAGVEALLAAPDLSRLTSLRLDFNDIGHPGVAALVAYPRLNRLKELSLADNRFGSRAAQRLVAAPHLANLVRLEVQGNILSERATGMLRRRFGDRVRLE